MARPICPGSRRLSCGTPSLAGASTAIPPPRPPRGTYAADHTRPDGISGGSRGLAVAGTVAFAAERFARSGTSLARTPATGRGFCGRPDAIGIGVASPAPRQRSGRLFSEGPGPEVQLRGSPLQSEPGPEPPRPTRGGAAVPPRRLAFEARGG